jgi:hypothetical protein
VSSTSTGYGHTSTSVELVQPSNAERWISSTASNCYAQLAIVKKGYSMRWYFNGEQVGMATSPSDIQYGNSDLVFGQEYYDPNR